MASIVMGETRVEGRRGEWPIPLIWMFVKFKRTKSLIIQRHNTLKFIRIQEIQGSKHPSLYLQINYEGGIKYSSPITLFPCVSNNFKFIFQGCNYTVNKSIYKNSFPKNGSFSRKLFTIGKVFDLGVHPSSYIHTYAPLQFKFVLDLHTPPCHGEVTIKMFKITRGL